MKQFPVSDVYSPGAGGLDPEESYRDYPVKFLAQGDSWFMLGAIPPWETTNILFPLNLSYDSNACAVNCALSGRELVSMVDWSTNSSFSDMLNGRLQYKWNAILLSGGGNDLITALAILPRLPGGKRVALADRLLLEKSEWDTTKPGVDKYISETGWIFFSNRLKAEFKSLVQSRDSGVNKGIPIFFHTYDYPVPRNAPAGFGFGPWMYPELSPSGYDILPDDWNDLSKAFIDRLAQTLRDVVNENKGSNLYLVDTRDTLTPAKSGTEGKSGDWQNEIHPTEGGYKKISAKWKLAIEKVVKYTS